MRDFATDQPLRKFMWWRLTNSAVEKVLDNNGATFFEQQLLRKYNISLRITGTDIFFAKNKMNPDDMKYVHVGKVAAIQSYYMYKGNQLNEYDVIIMDEIVRAESEKRTFNIPKAFINMIENVCRKRKGIRVMIYANAIGEMQEIKQLFGFMPFPGKFGVYKIWYKRAVIEYLDDSKEWKEEQDNTMAGWLKRGIQASEFSNVHVNPMEDLEDFIIQRKHIRGKIYFCSLMIDRGVWLDIHSVNTPTDNFYYIDGTHYTSKRMAKTNRYALDRSLVTARTKFSRELVTSLRDLWEVGKFRFSNSMNFERFTEALDKYNIVKMR